MISPQNEILFLESGPYSLDRREENDKFKYFSEYFSCNLLTPVNRATKKNTKLKETQVTNNFILTPFPYYYKNSILRSLFSFYNIVLKAFLIYYVKKRKFKIVISRDPLLTGLCALIIAKITCAKSIIEVNGDFGSAFLFDELGKPEISLMGKIKNKVGKNLMKFVLLYADGIRLLYDNQLDFIFTKKELERMPIVNFSDFTSIKPFLNQKKIDRKYILLVGYPWFLKGVDILIKAFIKISSSFPDYRLKIVGWCPEGREYFENLAKDNAKIELCNPVSHKDVIPLFSQCSLYVLASRTEAMGRVILEAMAIKKPVIASNVGGVPAIIKNGYTGILFEKENVNDLAEKIKSVLSNSDLADKLAENGYQYVKQRQSEQRYIENYMKMIEKIL